MSNIYAKYFDFRGREASSISSLEWILSDLKRGFKKFSEDTEVITQENTPNNFKDIIEFYNFYNNKIKELEYRINPHFNLVRAKREEPYDKILAKVKWAYNFKGKQRNQEFITVFISSTKKYPNGIKDPELESYAKEKIYQYFYKNAPIELMDINGNTYIL